MKQCRILWVLAAALCSSLISVSSADSSGMASSIRLRNAVIDTSAAVRQARAGVLGPQDKISADSESMLARFGDEERRLPFIIQFTGPVRQSWKQAVEQTGARLGGYLPENAFVVELTSGQLGKVAELESVQWLGPFEPDYKTDPALSRRVASALKTLGPVAVEDETFRVQTFSSETVFAVRDAVLDLHGKVISVASAGRRGLLRVRLSVASVSALLDLPEVEFIEVYVEPELSNNVGTDSEHMNVQSLWTNFNLTGAGQIVCVADTGLDTGDTSTIHPDFSNRVIAAIALGRSNDWSDSTSHGGHGTHVSGSVLGSGAAWSNGLFRGAAPEAALVMQSIMDSEGRLGGIPDSLVDLFLQAYTNGARIHTDSWGARVYGEYTVDSQSADQFMWDVRDMLILFSAGNSGVDGDSNGVIDATSIGAPGTAKNVLTVGAAESDRPSGSGGYSAYPYGSGSWLPDYSVYPIRDDLISTAFDTYQGMAAFSSRGPCVDGRIKPDIVAPGTDIISCRSSMPGASTLWGTGAGVLAIAASNFYTFCGGTSMSTPLTAGAAALVRQYLCEQRGFAAPSAALMKAIMVNGARSLSPGQYGTGQYLEIPARPNNVEGWGQVDLANTLFPPAGWTNAYYDMTNTAQAMDTGDSTLFAFFPSGTNKVSVTLCWSDYPASLSAEYQMVNDLDLTVTTPDGVVHYPNGLAEADRLNNLEGVDVSSATHGPILIRVSGYNVPNGPQPYALVIRGAGSAHVPEAVSDYDGDGKSDPAVFERATGYWSILYSSTLSLSTVKFGNSDCTAVCGDYDGDGKNDLAVFDSATGYWFILYSSTLESAMAPFGHSGCMPVGGDYDGDGETDATVYDPASGYWHILYSSTLTIDSLPLGDSGCIPLGGGDYDGDGKTDVTVYDPATGYWRLILSGTGSLSTAKFGDIDCIPVRGDFDGDGKTDLAVYQESTGYWFWLNSGSQYSLGYQKFGEPGHTPLTGDYDGDGRMDLAVYQESSGHWHILYSSTGGIDYFKFGGSGHEPVQ